MKSDKRKINMIVWLRSLIYWVVMVSSLLIFFLVAYLIIPLPPMTRYKIISHWARFIIFWVRICCGIKYTMTGKEHIPVGPAIVMCKHQSAWETMALQQIFPPQVWVMKREIFSIPFFGWAIRTLSPIAINRSSRAEAQKELMEQGKDRVDQGFWIVIFPEGTRILPGSRGHYHSGGARLALDLGLPIVPVALNSGEFWPKNAFLRWPGEILVHIGPPIFTKDRKARDIMKEVETWIETKMDAIPNERRGPCYPMAATATKKEKNAESTVSNRPPKHGEA